LIPSIHMVMALYASFFILFVSFFLNKKKFAIPKTIVSFLFLFVSIVISLMLPNFLLKEIAIVVIIFAYHIIFFKTTLFQSFIQTVGYLLLFIVGDTIAGLIIIHFFDVHVHALKTDLVYINYHHILLFLILLIELMIITLVNKSSFLAGKTPFQIHPNVLVVLFTLAMLVTITINGMILIKSDLENGNILLLGLLLILIYSVLNTIAVNIYLKLQKEQVLAEQQQAEYDRLQSYTHTLEEVMQDLKRSRHDYLNILLSLKGLLDVEQDSKKAQIYLEEVLKEEKRNIESGNKIFSALELIQNPSVKGFLRIKVAEAINKKLQVTIHMDQKIQFHAIHMMDLIKIIGILMDNAIEASEKSIRKPIIISLKKHQDGITMIIANSFHEKPNLTKMFKEGYSTKGENRGFGLSNVKQLIETKYNNLLLHSWIKNDLFFQELNIKAKNK